MDSAGHYVVLGLGPSATAAEIRKAYHRLALRHHPDTNPGDASAAERFRRLAEAYRVLSDPELRAAYDADVPDSTAAVYLVCEVDRIRVSQNAGLEVVFSFPAEGRAFQKPRMPGWLVTAGPTVEQRWYSRSAGASNRETRLHYTLAPLQSGFLNIPACRVMIRGKLCYSTPVQIQVDPADCVFRPGDHAGTNPVRIHLHRIREIRSGTLRKTRVYDRTVLIPRGVLASWYHRIGSILAWSFPLIGAGYSMVQQGSALLGMLAGGLIAVPAIRSMYRLAGVKPLRTTAMQVEEVRQFLDEGYMPGLMPPISRRLSKLQEYLRLWLS
ncbi:MAG: DnaJ domain-containing protein [Bacteroidota bacterium]|jgi:hypothetical protein